MIMSRFETDSLYAKGQAEQVAPCSHIIRVAWHSDIEVI